MLRKGGDETFQTSLSSPSWSPSLARGKGMNPIGDKVGEGRISLGRERQTFAKETAWNRAIRRLKTEIILLIRSLKLREEQRNTWKL